MRRAYSGRNSGKERADALTRHWVTSDEDGARRPGPAEASATLIGGGALGAQTLAAVSAAVAAQSASEPRGGTSPSVVVHFRRLAKVTSFLRA